MQGYLSGRPLTRERYDRYRLLRNPSLLLKNSDTNYTNHVQIQYLWEIKHLLSGLVLCIPSLIQSWPWKSLQPVPWAWPFGIIMCAAGDAAPCHSTSPGTTPPPNLNELCTSALTEATARDPGTYKHSMESWLLHVLGLQVPLHMCRMQGQGAQGKRLPPGVNIQIPPAQAPWKTVLELLGRSNVPASPVVA